MSLLGYKGRKIRLWCFVGPAPHRASLCVISMRPVAREQTNVASRDANRARFFFFSKGACSCARVSTGRRPSWCHPRLCFVLPPPVDCLASDSVFTPKSAACWETLRWFRDDPQSLRAKQKGSSSRDHHADQWPRSPRYCSGGTWRLGRKWWSPHLGAITHVWGGVGG